MKNITNTDGLTGVGGRYATASKDSSEVDAGFCSSSFIQPPTYFSLSLFSMKYKALLIHENCIFAFHCAFVSMTSLSLGFALSVFH